MTIAYGTFHAKWLFPLRPTAPLHAGEEGQLPEGISNTQPLRNPTPCPGPGSHCLEGDKHLGSDDFFPTIQKPQLPKAENRPTPAAANIAERINLISMRRGGRMDLVRSQMPQDLLCEHDINMTAGNLTPARFICCQRDFLFPRELTRCLPASAHFCLTLQFPVVSADLPVVSTLLLITHPP